MDTTPHRKSPDRVRELKERAQELVRQQLAGRRLCDRCGATFSTYADKCAVDLDDSCPGKRAIDDATATAQQRVGLR
jgi:hypothetical protein